MADTKVSALSAFTPVLADLIYGVDDPGGTPVSGQFTLQVLLTLLEAATKTLTNTTIDADGTGNSITNIENADIKAAAAIAVNKLAALTASEVVVTDGSGFLTTESGVSNTEVGYLNGVTSAIQTQLDAKRLQGKETIWVPAGAMRPTVSNGCAALTDVETTAGRPDMTVLDFDATADEHAQFQVAFPKSWNESTVTFQVFWTTTATDTDGVAWGLQGVAVSDNDTIDVAYGTAVVVTDDALGAAEDLMVSAESGAVTIGGSPADADIVYFRFFRDVSDANDDMTEDARLIGVKLFYTVNAEDDA